MKLGLGDFVFYSVLVSRAGTSLPSSFPHPFSKHLYLSMDPALFDWVTTVTVMVSVLTGLNMTIFLLIFWQKALPALPISIAFGLLFYFISSITLVPFLNVLISAPSRVLVGVNDTSGLWVGASGGGGMVFM